MFALETLGSLKSADLLEKSLAILEPPRTTPLNVYLQVNTSGEDSKAGLLPLVGSDADTGADLFTLAAHIVTACPHLRLTGLMTIGSIQASTATGEVNPDFASLNHSRARLTQLLSEKLQVQGLQLDLSMGMSGDFAEAIHQGSGNVRVGSSIFGARPPLH